MPYNPPGYFAPTYWPAGWSTPTSISPPANDRRDMLEWGLTAMSATMKAVASQSVTYARGLDSVDVRATYGKKLLKLSDGQGGTRMEWTDMDFLIDAADLVLGGESIEPARGDAIYLIAGDVVQQFEVAPYGDEPPWRWSDPYHLKYRIHAKHVADEPYAP